MILAELRDYLQTHGRVALIDLSNRFDTDPDALRGMLQKWVEKGRVERVTVSSACGTGCGKCDLGYVETYIWKG